MRKILLCSAFLFAAVLLVPVARCQTDNVIHAKEFPGLTVGARVAAAQAQCGAMNPCIIVIDASMASFATGTMPALCARCTLADFRSGYASVTAGPTLTNPAYYSGATFDAQARACFAYQNVSGSALCDARTQTGALTITSPINVGDYTHHAQLLLPLAAAVTADLPGWGISSISSDGTTVTIVTSANTGLQLGNPFHIAGVTNTQFDTNLPWNAVINSITVGSGSDTIKVKCQSPQVFSSCSAASSSGGWVEPYAIYYADGSTVEGSYDPALTKSSPAVLKVGSNSGDHMAGLLAPFDARGTNGTDGSNSGGVKNIVLAGSSANSGVTLLDVQGIYSGSVFANVYTEACYGYGVTVLPGSGDLLAVTSDVDLSGNFDCTGTSGSFPLSILSYTGAEVATLRISGQAQHAGAGNAEVTINGHGSGTIYAVDLTRLTHIEGEQTRTAAVSITDAWFVNLAPVLNFSGTAPTTLVNVADSASGNTQEIRLGSLMADFTTTNAICDNTTGGKGCNAGTVVDSETRFTGPYDIKPNGPLLFYNPLTSNLKNPSGADLYINSDSGQIIRFGSGTNNTQFYLDNNGTLWNIGNSWYVAQNGQQFASQFKLGSTSNHSYTRKQIVTCALSPAAVAANTCAAQTGLTCTGVSAGDNVLNSASAKPTDQAGLILNNVRVTAANTISLNFCNVTASPITPTASESYTLDVEQ